MTNSSIIKNTGIGLSVIGVITSGSGLHLRKQANAMIKALDAGGNLFGFDSSTYRSMGIWGDKLTNANTILIIGIVLLIIGIIMCYCGYLKANAVNNPERKVSDQNTVDRLNKLKEAKQLGFITDDEYEVKRKEIIDTL